MRLLNALAAKALGRPLALCDANDVDGIASAALFLRRHPNGVVVLAYPAEIQRGGWLRWLKWDFVADLPCPGRAEVRADHHETNKPCARSEFYDPEAPASAVLALKALGLKGDSVAEEIAEAARQTDTADIRDEAVRGLDLAVRYASYDEKIRIIKALSREGLRALGRPEIAALVERGRKYAELVGKIADSLPRERELAIYSPAKLPISYRSLTIEMQRRGSAYVNILVKLGPRKYRLYCGADRGGGYDCTKIARALGGGGHKYAAGAEIKAPLLDGDRPLRLFLDLAKPKVLYVLGPCEGIKVPCKSISV
ncbi:MAG: Fis family transcriptional regulator [Thermoproteus sp.]|nr:Fis family transcriptional regulator [Thermoproteus sp.]